MPAGKLLRAGVLVLIAPAGVIIGHALTYVLAVPDPAERAAVLAATGHAWWTLGSVAGAVLAALGALLFVVAVLRRPPDGGRFRRDLSRWLGPRLAACQLSLFLMIEVVERAVVGDPFSGDPYHEIIQHGVLAQITVALAVTGLCWCLALAFDLACVVVTREPVPAAVGLLSIAPSRVHPSGIRRHLVEARAPPRVSS